MSMLTPVRAIFIFVSGPYAPAPSVTDSSDRRRIVEENIRCADEVALAITRKGHVPFVPHTMMRGWEDFEQIDREEVLRVCRAWISRCDALYLIAPSPGADAELQFAAELDLPVYGNLAEIPEGAHRASGSRPEPR